MEFTAANIHMFRIGEHYDPLLQGVAGDGAVLSC